MWLIIILDKSYTTTYPFIFSVKNQPANLALKEPLPDNSLLIINGRGWDLLKMMYSHDTVSLDIAIENFRTTRKVLITNNYKETFKSSLPEGVRIIRIIPDTLILEFEKVLRKKVPVKPDLDISFRKQYGQSGKTIIEPSFVTISGPQSYVNDIEYIRTIPIMIKNVSKSINKTIQLSRFSKSNVEFSSNTVNINIPVEKLTEGKYIIPVKLFNSGKEKITLIPDKIEVSFQSPINIFKKVKPESFMVYIDMKSNKKLTSGKLKVKLEVNQPFIYFIKPYPEFVDYIIEK
jgi:hypothetical protein